MKTRKRTLPAFALIAVAALFGSQAIAPSPARAATEEQKKLAYSIVERNAEPIATLSDNIYYFAELGMQEFESAKLLKETLE